MNKDLRAIFCFLGVMILSVGCSGPPYIYVDGEFDRNSGGFLNRFKNRDVVEVCYSKGNATPSQIVDLATKECKKFGKKAFFHQTAFDICPLRTPVAAVYRCLATRKPIESGVDVGS